jgi:hypothetical protein
MVTTREPRGGIAALVVPNGTPPSRGELELTMRVPGPALPAA